MEYNSALEVILRAGAITAQARSEEQSYNPDLLISPLIKEYFWYEFDRFREIINAGEEAAVMMLDRIPQRRSQPRRAFQRLFRLSLFAFWQSA